LADIFLSYSREDQATARRFAQAFEREGFSVWWDATLHSGEAYDQVTEKALREARAVVVLWSKKSVDSRWVRSEATTGDRNKTLVPVMIEPCLRPVMFELTHTADLSHWNGSPNDREWQAYLEDVRRFIARGDPVQPAVSPSAPHVGTGRARRIGIAMIAGLALILGAGGIWWLVTQDGPVRAAAPSAQATAGVSLAVLPFADMSPEHNQEYFSDGLAEELLNELAQIRSLRVAGRTSSFSFKGRNEDLRVIGEKLGVNHLLEGSVRKDGSRLRITAQLISAVDGTHLWSQTYDRELSDIFAVQEEIAMAVSEALRITLDVGEMSRANGGTNNVEAYDRFLQGQALWNLGGPREVDGASQRYREAVALDPAFARAWRGLNKALTQLMVYGVSPETTGKELGEVISRLDALAPDAWWTQAVHLSQSIKQRKWLEADAAGRAAIAAAPGTEMAADYADYLLSIGRANEGLVYARRAGKAEPLSLAHSRLLQAALGIAGLPDEAQAEYVRSKDMVGERLIPEVFALFRLWKRPDADPEAIKAQFRLVAASGGSNRFVIPGMTPGNVTDPKAAVAVLKKAFENPADQNATLAIYADHFGDRDLALAALRAALVDRRGPQLWSLWQTNETGLRSDPRFNEILRDLGMVDLFRASGNWGDFCNPVGEDFECR
jgi:TolB-like protein/tetratricopeptide (TPR) repeat protein